MGLADIIVYSDSSEDVSGTPHSSDIKSIELPYTDKCRLLGVVPQQNGSSGPWVIISTNKSVPEAVKELTDILSPR
jgi:hypothetical protein